MKNNSIVISIALGNVLIAGSLVFLGFQMSSNSATYEDIEQGIEAYIQKQQEESNKVSYKGDIVDDDAILGNPKAKLTIVEFSDYQCPFCRKFYNETLPKIKEKYIDTGEINLVYRDFPLDFHKGAVPAAAAAECARDQGGDEMYYQMHDKIFDGQNLLGQGTVNIPNESLISYAQELDLDMPKFNECFESEEIRKEINEDYLVGQQIGITGTPAFVIDGKLLEGAQPFEVFDSAIQSVLK
jgi:protein-disulfide isomerase